MPGCQPSPWFSKAGTKLLTESDFQGSVFARESRGGSHFTCLMGLKACMQGDLFIWLLLGFPQKRLQCGVETSHST